MMFFTALGSSEGCSSWSSCEGATRSTALFSSISPSLTMSTATLIAAVAVLVLLNLSYSYAQHGKGTGSGGPGVNHKPMTTHGKAATQGTHTKLTPSQMLAGKPKLTDKLKGLLPDGTDMATVCDGFRNLGQCVAAVHVSNNLKMEFTELKTKMVGTAATANAPAVAPVSLGKAIQAINPKADAPTEVKKATKQANDDLKV